MYTGVRAVQVMEDYQLLLTFENDEQRVFDVKPYLHFGIFSQLRDKQSFASVHVSFDTVEWNNGADLCPEMLYRKSVKIS